MMNLIPKSKEEFSQKDYWDRFFKKRGNKAFEWYGEYPELASYLHKYLKPQDNILIVGCGNSSLGQDLYDVGCRNVTNIDISKTVIKQMLSQNQKERSGLRYLEMDALNTSFDNEQFSVIIDKGTLDALMSDELDATVENVNKYFSEIQRVLKNTGRYICISLLQDHILLKLLDYFPSNNWMFRIVRCFESELKSIANGENAMPVFMVVCTKFKQLPRKILEVNLGSEDKMLKCQLEKEVVSHIQSAQRAAFVCSALKKTSIGGDNEISMEVYDQKNQSQPRYTVYIVETAPDVKNNAYAAFIVPEGREAEWLFSTQTGRKHLVDMTKHNRLSIVTMHRGQKYESLDAVKDELEDVVRNLAPANLGKSKIPFLTLGADIGKRTVRYEGTSYFSGDYVIEDIEHDTGEKYRRLFYLSSQLVIQSEARFKTIKARGGKKKDFIDLTTLTCQHHIYMSVAAQLSIKNKEKSDVVVLGLGGGGLCSFLRKFSPNAEIMAVDIDPEMLKIATQWFGFKPDDHLKAKIQDGLEFIQNLHKEGAQTDAILCDVDNKNLDMGMSCPPKEFLAQEILIMVSNLIGNKGVFVVNIVLRDVTLRSGILKNFKEIFKKVISYKLTEDLNEVFICTNIDKTEQYFIENLRESCKLINAFFKQNNVDDSVQIEDYIKNLQIN
ncbi:hypothetical protein ABEB36_012271 [Hypothenemus hampei]|uniref:Methyltransferase type 11 domain-containing protein n=1 Tax=Hypothenemus hampei TaxID=57062 RepID=A0ABD1EAR9_HYPHA